MSNSIETAIILDDTIIRSTFLESDLVPVFLTTLELFDADKAQLIVNEYEELGYGPAPVDFKTRGGMSWSHELFPEDASNHPFWNTDSAVEMRVDLEDALNEVAPEGFYFGSTEGNASDFGFWPIEEQE